MGLRIDERIASRRTALSPQERRAAETLIEHLDDLATYRAAELADLAGVSKATMSRLFRSLGYADFDEVREDLRALRATGEPRQTDAPASLPAYARAEAAAVSVALSSPAIGDAVAAIASARRVLVVGWRNSHAVALHLRQQLAQAREDVRLAPAPGQVLGEELADLADGDTVVVLGFRRRPAGFAAFVTEAARTGARVVLVGDPTAAEHARRAGPAGIWLECPVATEIAFDSYAAAMSLVAVLADGVLTARGPRGRARVTGISTAYVALREVE
ncbi:MurR/RpiR family transcriptional regulator [Nocardioides zeae]|uniref:MurR/RpiR family transcriptional regulator n=1 Tax=Nocardioides imazamoxiresistens TaxID=3231893 RepID=A0ABU3PQJ3_9ACTN|nr:MurR/RpiR family transcriptional regulator [Nocardioides zeae]MDT9591498.1 MurR/RpiR family transcriptional regulator [Nocardioides zeae]